MSASPIYSFHQKQWLASPWKSHKETNILKEEYQWNARTISKRWTFPHSWHIVTPSHCPEHGNPSTLIRTNKNILRPLCTLTRFFSSPTLALYLSTFYQTRRQARENPENKIWNVQLNQSVVDISNVWTLAISSIFATTDAFTLLLIWLHIFFPPISS